MLTFDDFIYALLSEDFIKARKLTVGGEGFPSHITNVLLTEKNCCVLLNLVQEWLVGCFWPFWYVYIIG